MAVGALRPHAPLGVLRGRQTQIQWGKSKESEREKEEIRSSVRLVLSPEEGGKKAAAAAAEEWAMLMSVGVMESFIV